MCISILHNLFIRSNIKFVPLSGVFDLVNKTASIIEINGNRYDAASGQLVGAAKRAVNNIKRPINGFSIDGFSKPAKMVRKSATKRSIYKLQRRPERSKTLMRRSVKKPIRQQPQSRLKTRGLAPNPVQASRAANVRKDSKVQRFGILSFSSRNKSSQAKSGEVIARGAHFSTTAPASLSTSLSVAGAVSHYKLERLLDYALANADAHKKAEQTRRNNQKYFGRLPRWMLFSVLALVLAGAFGLFIWHKMPVASMKLAATKAHINASLPTPISGYKIGPISYSEHAVTTSLQSITDASKKYTVTEQANNQPASSLAAAALAGGHQVQTVQDQDKTYVLSQDADKSQAACTKGNNTISVDSVGLNVAELLEAAKNACKT